MAITLCALWRLARGAFVRKSYQRASCSLAPCFFLSMGGPFENLHYHETPFFFFPISILAAVLPLSGVVAVVPPLLFDPLDIGLVPVLLPSFPFLPCWFGNTALRSDSPFAPPLPFLSLLNETLSALRRFRPPVLA